MLVPRRSGFTLVEIVLAVGIFAFVVIGVIGLLTTSIDSARSATTDTILAATTTDKITSLRSKPFLSLLDSFDSTSAGRIIISPSYYAVDGTPLPTAANAYYQCKLTGIPDNADRALATSINVVIVFSWPVTAAKPSTFSIPTKISRYD